jgi:hypothetical protein
MLIERKAERRCRCGFPHYMTLAGELMFGNEPPKSPDALDRKPLADGAGIFAFFLRTTACPRHCERSEAIHPSFARRNGLLRFARNDVESFEFQSAKRPHSHGTMPELCDSLSPMRGRRECRVLAAPAVSCAKST